MPESSGGSALGPIGAALLGAFTSRKKAVQELEMQKEIMMHGKILDVAGHVAKTELGGDASSRALQRHYDRMAGADPESQFKSKKAQREAWRQTKEVGVRGFTPGGKIEMQSVGRVLQSPSAGAEKARVRGGGKNKPSGQPDGGAPAPAPVVNEATQTVTPPNVGSRTPKASKGGYTQQALFTPKGNITKAAKPIKPKAKPPTTPPAGGMNA